LKNIENSVENRVFYRKMALGACGDMFRINYLYCRAKTICNSTPTVKNLMEKDLRVQNKSIF
jgi:hypothetical protein